MRDVIDIRPDDFLWRFYCKRFTVEGKEIQAPKNLCRYFWTSANGFGLWLGREVKLALLWVTVLVSFAILWALGLLLPKEPNTVGLVIFIAVAVVWQISFILSFYVTGLRAWRALKYRVPWVTYVVGGGIFSAILITAIAQGAFWPGIKQMFSEVFQWLGYIIIAAVILAFLAFLASRILHERTERLKRFFQTIGAVAAAKKRRYCPPLNPPQGFEPK
jgi:hypothetical protein